MLKPFGKFYLILTCFLMISISCEKEDSYNESLKDYQTYVEPTTSNKMENFFFVGRVGYETGLYKLNLKSNKYEPFWSASNENVIQLSYSDELDYVFFITARRLGAKQGVPFIKRIKLYSIDLKHSSVEQIIEIGDAVQLSAYWLDNNYKVQFTQFDMKIASHINKSNQFYSPFGKLIMEEIETFDFIKEGYPQFETKLKSSISPSGNFGIKQSEGSVFLSIADAPDKVFIDSTAGKISNVKWNTDEVYVFFRADSANGNVNNQISSKIYVYDIINKKIVRKWDSEDKINFIIANDLLILDTRINNRSAIDVFNYKKNEDIVKIHLKGGCGIINIL